MDTASGESLALFVSFEIRCARRDGVDGVEQVDIIDHGGSQSFQALVAFANGLPTCSVGIGWHRHVLPEWGGAPLPFPKRRLQEQYAGNLGSEGCRGLA